LKQFAALIDSIVSLKQDVVDDFGLWLLIHPAGPWGASGSGPEHGLPAAAGKISISTDIDI
jgi:hypothetical protein